MWEDEEADVPIHGENVARTMTTNGVVWNTYTPLKGQTDLTRDFEKRSKGDNPSVYLTRITWDDAPEATGLRWPLAAGVLITAIVWAWTWRRRATITAALEPRIGVK